MPRSVSGVYTTPVGTDAVPNQTIDSGKYNTNVHDVETDLNYPRPIVAGGTGATSAAGAIANLGGVSAVGATSMTGPLTVHANGYTNINIKSDTDYAELLIDSALGSGIIGMHNGVQQWGVTLGDQPDAGAFEINRINSGVFTNAFSIDHTTGQVSITGPLLITGTMTPTNAGIQIVPTLGYADLKIGSSNDYAELLINSALGSGIVGLVNDVQKWGITVGQPDSDNGGKFEITRITGTGPTYTYSNALEISRADGRITIFGELHVNNNYAGFANGYVNMSITSDTDRAEYVLNCAIAGGLVAQRNDLTRWDLTMPTSTAESGGNAGSNFSINRYDDAGGWIGEAFKITRSNGLVSIPGALNVTGGIGLSGAVNISNTTTAISSTTGALTVAGGAGVAGDFFAHTVSAQAKTGEPDANIFFVDETNAFKAGAYWHRADNSINLWTGSTAGEITLNANGVSISATNASTSSSTGALTIAGGLGVNGNAYFAGSGINVAIGNGIATGLFADGANIALRTYAAGASIYFQNAAGAAILGSWNTTKLDVPLTTASASPTTGALTIAGGLGVGGAIFGRTLGLQLATGGTYGQSIQIASGSGDVQGTVETNAGGYTRWGTLTNHGMRLVANNTDWLTISAAGVTNVVASTASTSTATGALTVAGGAGIAGAVNAGSLGRGAPVTKTADFTVAATENWLINNKSGSTCVVTLPTASSNTGREIMIQNFQAQLVNSASANVIPVGGGSAAAPIITAATAGKWVTLVSNGTNWQITRSN